MNDEMEPNVHPTYLWELFGRLLNITNVLATLVFSFLRRQGATDAEILNTPVFQQFRALNREIQKLPEVESLDSDENQDRLDSAVKEGLGIKPPKGETIH